MGVNVDLQINLLRPLSHESCTYAVSKENMLMQFKGLEDTILKDIFYRTEYSMTCTPSKMGEMLKCTRITLYTFFYKKTMFLPEPQFS